MNVVLARSLFVALTLEISLIMLFPNAFRYGSSFSGLMRRPAVDVQIKPPAMYLPSTKSHRGRKISERIPGRTLRSSVGTKRSFLFLAGASLRVPEGQVGPVSTGLSSEEKSSPELMPEPASVKLKNFPHGKF